MSDIETNKSIKSFILCLFIFFYPILPQFTEIYELPIYDYLIITLIISFFTTKSKNKAKKLLTGIKVYIPFMLLMFITYFYHHAYKSYVKDMLETVFVFALIYCQINTSELIEKLYDILLYGGFLLCLVGVSEYFTRFDIFSVIQTMPKNIPMGALVYDVRYGHRRIEGSFGQPLPFAAYLTFINIIALCKILNWKKDISRRKMFYCITWILSLICVFMTAARMELFMALALQIVAFIQIRNDKKILITYLVITVILIFVAIGKDISVIMDPIYTVISVFYPNFQSKSADYGTAYYRQQLYKNLSTYIKSRPLLGVGYNESMNVKFSQMGSYGVWYASSIDNNYLVWLLRYGIIGLLGNLYFNVLPLIICLKELIRKTYFNLKINRTTIIFTCLFIAYTIDLISVYQMGEQRVFIICSALVFSEYKLKNSKKLISNI